MGIEQTKQEYLTNCLNFGTYISHLKEERKGKKKTSVKKKVFFMKNKGVLRGINRR